MSEQTPQWFHKSEAARGWVQTTALILGGIVVFFAVDCRLKSSEARKNEIDARLTEQTAPFDVQIRKLDARRGEYSLRLVAANATVAETESQKTLKPLVAVTPHVEITSAYKDMSEIRCQAEFRNVGHVDATIRRLQTDVYRAIVTNDVKDIIERTQSIAELLSAVNRTPIGPEESAQREVATRELEKLTTQCPHAQLFSVSNESKDVTWEHIQRLSESHPVDDTLRPDQAVLHQFNYVLTESLQLHRSWFRLEIVVHLDDGSSQTFSFIVPTRRPRAVVELPTPVRYTPAQPPEGGDSTLYRWTPVAPLGPVKREDRTKE